MNKEIKKHESMRGYFAYELHKAMEENPDIWAINGDLGYGMYDFVKRDYPDRFVNTGAAEVTMLGVAIGLAKQGKRPFTYTISSFYMRAAEPIALYAVAEGLPIVMIGGGRDQDYAHDGLSHDATTTQDFMSMLGVKCYYPDTKEEMEELMKELVSVNEPVFVSLRR